MFAELVEWVMNLDREFAFLLALPFLVALAGLLADAKGRTARREPSPRARVTGGGPMTGAWSR